MNKINKTNTSTAQFIDLDGKKIPNFVNGHRYAPARQVEAVEKLMKLKKTKNPWEVIQGIVYIWTKTKPKEYNSYIVTQKATKERARSKVMKGSKFTGTSRDSKTGGTLRATYDIPVKIIKMIRRMYSPDELPMDKKFYQKLGRLFPFFKVSEKI